MKFTTALTAIAVLATGGSALMEAAQAAHAHHNNLNRRNHALGQVYADPAVEVELEKRGFEKVKRRETAAQKKAAKARVFAASKLKAEKLASSKAKVAASKAKAASSKAKAAAALRSKESASKSKASASKSKATSLKKYSTSSRSAATSKAKYSTSSRNAYSTSSKAKASSVAAAALKKAQAAATTTSKAAASTSSSTSSSTSATASILPQAIVTPAEQLVTTIKQLISSSSSSSSSSSATTTLPLVLSTSSSTTTSTTTTPPTSTSTTSTTSTSTTSSESSSAAASKGTTTSQKKGLGYNTASFTTAFGNSLAWAYNWANAPGGTLVSTVEFCPMLWGSDASGWSSAATSAIASGSKHLLGFNEPDGTTSGGGSVISPSAAAALWKTNMEPFAGKATLVSPAITNGGSPMGITWMQEFLGNCSSCTIDAIAMHWYDTATNLGYFTGYFNDAAVTFAPRKLWITEFMGSGTEAQQETFLETVIPYLEGKEEVERYAAFGDFAGTFVDSSGALTSLGAVYKNTV